jgi:hypothetical protein
VAVGVRDAVAVGEGVRVGVRDALAVGEGVRVGVRDGFTVGEVVGERDAATSDEAVSVWLV